MGFSDLLKQYLGGATAPVNADAADHYREIAAAAPASVVSEGIAAAMRSDQTPPFGQMVSQMFNNATPEQRSAMLNQLLGSLDPKVAASLGGPLGALVQGAGGGNITPQQASTITPEQVQQAATHAEQHAPSIIDTMSDFYAQHAGLVKTLGSAALTIALAKMANRTHA